MARTAPTECFFSEAEMATTEFADIGIYRMRRSGVEWSGMGWDETQWGGGENRTEEKKVEET